MNASTLEHRSALAKVAQPGAVEPIDPKAWAKRIMAKVAAGERVNPTAKTMAKAALGLTA